MATFGAIPYGSLVSNAIVVEPRGLCGGIPCTSGCADLSLSTSPITIPTTAVTFVLVSEGPEASCTRARRAITAVEAGAAGVIIVARTLDDTQLTAATNDATDNLLELQKVRSVPVGMMDSTEGKRLKDAVLSYTGEGKGWTRIDIDFRAVIPKAAVAPIDIWHTTADTCGLACDQMQAFMMEMRAAAKSLAPGHPISITPRYIIESCTGGGAGANCNNHCINNGRYCHFPQNPQDAFGAPKVAEAVRQKCLFSVLGNNTRPFWDYVAEFHTECTTDKRTFNPACSDGVFDRTQSQTVAAAWKACTAQVGNDVGIPAVDAEMRAMGAAGVFPWMRSAVTVSGQQFRGNLDKAHVMKAACSGLTNTSTIGVCDFQANGFCTPGSAGDLVCKNGANQGRRSTTCIEQDNDVGYECVCDAGYAEARTANGVRACADVNECTQYGGLCGDHMNNRNVCQNLPGSYRCIYNVPDMCTPENEYGGCWSGTVDGVSVTACDDRLGDYRNAALFGNPLPPLAVCTCDHLAGCWDMAQDGSCQERCGAEDCNPYTKQCIAGGGGGGGVGTAAGSGGGSSGVPAGGIAGITITVVLLVGAAVTAAFVWHRRSMRSEMRAEVQKYVKFEDGVDGDTIAMGDNGAALAPHVEPNGSDKPFTDNGHMDARQELQ